MAKAKKKRRPRTRPKAQSRSAKAKRRSTRKAASRKRAQPKRKKRPKRAQRAKRQEPKRPRRGWTRMRMSKMLDVRICDLDLRIEGTFVGECVERVHEELARRGLKFKPYFWISDDWFTPDGVTGVAVPFYLLHPRLIALQRRRVGTVDGSTKEWCMRIVRHEVGHAIDHAYEFHRTRRWHRTFGPSGRAYPREYQPNPHSRRHVQHLEYWYAQSHPDEDFAETFAVWLAKPKAWRTLYEGWPALRKLEVVDELMTEVAGVWPENRTRTVLEPASKNFKTLREYYAEQGRPSDVGWPRIYDRDLLQLFSDKPRHADHEAASAFIRRARREVIKVVTPWVGEYAYHLQHVVLEMIGRCRELDLRVIGRDPPLKRALGIILAKYTTDAVYRKRGTLGM